MKAPVATVVAILSGWIILVGYFVPDPRLQGVRSTMLGWAVVLAGIATLVAIFNLLKVHWHRLSDRGERDPLSLIVLLSFTATFAAGLWLTPADAQFRQVVTSIQVPIETSLLAVLAISLALAAGRLVQRRRSWVSILFLLSAMLFWLLGSGVLTAFSGPAVLRGLADVFGRFTLAGGRGILLGIALGSLATGLRVLLGQDRPYRG